MNDLSSLTQSPLTFDRFEPGQSLGSYEQVIDETMLRLWEELYGAKLVRRAPLPLALAPLIMMRAFLTVVTPRPPGNLHVGHTCAIREMPRAGEVFTASVGCSAKELRKDRRVVDFAIDIQTPSAADPILSGVATIFWAQ